MLCYRCGSYNADGNRKCAVCGQAFSTQRRASRNLTTSSTPQPKKLPIDVGTRLAERYRITGSGGQGAAGYVLRARDEEVDVDVAVKLIAPNLLQTEDERQAFLKCVKQARRVQHPNVVRIYDEGRDDRHVFYTMPFLEGLTLRKIIDLRVEKNEVFSVAEALPLFGQLALGLDSLGGQAHGALRPGNILVLPDVLKITGVPHFTGLPRRPFVAAQTQLRALEYLAPEARRDTGDVDPRSDVYSLAVIFGEMLTGALYGKDPLGWTKALHRLPRRIAQVLGQALTERPDDRFGTPGSFFDALAEAIADMQLDSEPVPLGQGRAPGILENELTDADVPPSPRVETRPSGARPPPPPSDAPAQPSVKVLPPTIVDPLSKPLNEPLPARFAERRGGTVVPKSTSGHTRKAKGGLLWVFLLVLFLGGVAIAAATFLRNRPDVALEPAQRTFTPEPLAPLPKAEPAKVEIPKTEPAHLGTPTPEAHKVEAPKAEAPKVEPAKVEAKAEPKPEPKAEPKPEPRKDPPKPEPDRPEKHAVVTPPEPPPPTAATDKGCPVGMVEISSGSFEFGSDNADPMRGFGELNARSTKVDGYCVDVFEYPNQRGKAPATGYNWTKAKSACEKQGKRLCSESEWERACKGARNLRYPFGNEFNAGVCNIGEGGSNDKKAVDAGGFGRCRSAYGVADMTGNVAEWTGSRWSDDVADKVVKGGAADQASYTGRCSARVNESAGGKHNNLGFRCCADLH